MGIFKVIRNTNDELQYLYNVLNYTMGIHTDYDKRYSPNVDIYHAYEQFLSVKKYFGKTSGNPAFHFIVVYDARSTWGGIYEPEHCILFLGQVPDRLRNTPKVLLKEIW